MEIKTKYDIGDMVYFVQLHDGFYRIEYEPIKEIHYGGHPSNLYQFRLYSRPEREVYSNFDDAKQVAIELQKQQNEREMEIVIKYKKSSDGRCMNG